MSSLQPFDCRQPRRPVPIALLSSLRHLRARYLRRLSSAAERENEPAVHANGRRDRDIPTGRGLLTSCLTTF